MLTIELGKQKMINIWEDEFFRDEIDNLNLLEHNIVVEIEIEIETEGMRSMRYG